MPPGPPRTPPIVFGLALIAALAVCAIFAAVTVPTLLGQVGAWPVLVAGIFALVGALAGLWRFYRWRDRRLW